MPLRFGFRLFCLLAALDLWVAVYVWCFVYGYLGLSFVIGCVGVVLRSLFFEFLWVGVSLVLDWFLIWGLLILVDFW